VATTGADQSNLSAAGGEPAGTTSPVTVVDGARHHEVWDPTQDGSPPQPRRTTYPLVTTGGGALPLPTCAQPAMLRRASTAAIATESFFIGDTPFAMTERA
jgi:hypothetical protein